jgi:adenylate cyclase
MKKLTKVLLNPWMAILTLLLVVAIKIANPTFVESVQLRYFDTLITSNSVVESENVVLVDIDDAALEKYGQWPFPRDQYAEVIKDLYNHGAGLVVFNVFMPDADRFGKDSVLAETLSTLPIVLPQTATNDPIKTTTKAFRPGVSVIGNPDINFTVNYENIQPNVKAINDVITGAGVVNTFPEVDGVVRRIPMLVSSQGMLYPSISLETLRVASGDPSFQVKVSDIGIEAVRIPKFGKVTTDTASRIWVDWSHKPTRYSLDNVPADLGGKIAILGLTARGLNNPIASPTGELYPHDLQGSVLDTLISGTNIARPDWAMGAEVLSMALIGLILIVVANWRKA